MAPTKVVTEQNYSRRLIYLYYLVAFYNTYASNKIHAPEYYVLGKNLFDCCRFVAIVQLNPTLQYVVQCLLACFIFFQISNAWRNFHIAGLPVDYAAVV